MTLLERCKFHIVAFGTSDRWSTFYVKELGEIKSKTLKEKYV